MNFKKEIIKKAKKTNGTIVLVEAHMDDRVLKALEIIVKQKLCKVVVFKSEKYNDKIKNSDFVRIIDLENYEKSSVMADKLYELRKHKGVTSAQAKKLIKDPTYIAAMLCLMGEADGVVCGAVHSTADTIRPALQLIKAKDSNPVIASVILIRKKLPGLLIFSDAGLLENPSETDLAHIAVCGAQLLQTITTQTPKVALLSYSTKGSAKSEMVAKIQNATKIAKKLAKNIEIDGELQFDAAIDETVAKQKKVTGSVGGHANVLVFPDLNSGNIAYKIANKLAGFTALGPITSNLKKPVNDLSRGCSVNEIVLTVAVTLLQI